MKTVKFFIAIILGALAMTACVTVNYPQSVIAELETLPSTPKESEKNTDTEPETETDIIVEIDLDISESAAKTTEPAEVTEAEASAEPESAPHSEIVSEKNDTVTESEEPKETDEPTVQGDIRLIYLTTPVAPNQTATIDVKGKPHTEYNISVVYSTAESTAKGLENKISDDYGFVSWSWKIGPSVKTGSYKIKITGENSVFETYIHVD